MRKTTIYLVGALVALLFIGISAMQMKAGQEDNGRKEEDLHRRYHSGEHMPRHAPVVVAEREFKGQTTSIPVTTLFTPACDCMFRISVYQEQPDVENTLDLGPLTQAPYLSWTDDFSQYQSAILTGSGLIPAELGKPAYYTHQIIVHSAANQPIQFNALEDPRDHSAFDMYVVVEEL
jgi:hypothetical protein